MSGPIKLAALIKDRGLSSNFDDVLQQFALDVAIAVLDGVGVTVDCPLRVSRHNGKSPYSLRAGDTLRCMEVTGAVKFLYINSDKDLQILSAQQRIAELMDEVTTLRKLRT